MAWDIGKSLMYSRGRSTDRPPIIKPYQRKGKMEIAPPVAQITTIRNKHHPDYSHANMEAYQDNSRKLDKTHPRQGSLTLKGKKCCEEESPRENTSN